MWTLLVALLLAAEANAPKIAPCPSGAAPRIALPCYPDPTVWEMELAARLPADGIYILLDQADWPEGTVDGKEPDPVSGHPYPFDGGNFVVLDRKSVVGRGRTIRVGEHWNVWVEGTAHEVVITGFARREKHEGGVPVFDEVYATAHMPKALATIVGPCPDFPPRHQPGEFLAAPVSPPARRSDSASAALAIDEKSWLRSFAKKLPEEHRTRIGLAKIERHEIVQCGEARTLAVLNLSTGICPSDYYCDDYSQVRIYGSGGRILHDSGLQDGLTEAQVADANGDGSDELLVCRGHAMTWYCDIMRGQRGRIVLDHYEMYSGC